MASELRVNTLKDAAGNNSIATSFVANGSSKAWVDFNGTGTVAILDSLNTSSITDSATGRYRHVFSSALNTANYASNYSTNATSSYTTSALVVGQAEKTTSRISVEGIWAGSYADSSSCMNVVMGDLA
jgi:hypothetical protein